MKKQKLTLEFIGDYKKPKLYIDDQRIAFESLNIAGDKTVGYDVILGLSQSKTTESAVKLAGNCGESIGFEIPNDETYEDDEEI